jgi:hypothetical protein
MFVCFVCYYTFITHFMTLITSKKRSELEEMSGRKLFIMHFILDIAFFLLFMDCYLILSCKLLLLPLSLFFFERIFCNVKVYFLL